MRDHRPLSPIVTIGDPPNIAGATACNGLIDVMALLQRGRIDLGFIGGAEVDRFGNLNTNWTPEIRLPGSGGAADIASFARRTVIIMTHEPRRLCERVQYLTSAGHGIGKGWRQSVGLSGGGPSKVVTSLGVFSFDDSGEMILTSLHPGITEEEVQANTGWILHSAPTVTETRPRLRKNWPSFVSSIRWGERSCLFNSAAEEKTKFPQPTPTNSGFGITTNYSLLLPGSHTSRRE